MVLVQCGRCRFHAQIRYKKYSMTSDELRSLTKRISDMPLLELRDLVNELDAVYEQRASSGL